MVFDFLEQRKFNKIYWLVMIISLGIVLLFFYFKCLVPETYWLQKDYDDYKQTQQVKYDKLNERYALSLYDVFVFKEITQQFCKRLGVANPEWEDCRKLMTNMYHTGFLYFDERYEIVQKNGNPTTQFKDYDTLNDIDSFNLNVW